MYNTHTYIYIYVNIYIYIHEYIYIYIHEYIYMCVSVYVYTDVYTYIYYIKCIYVLVLFGTRLPGSIMGKKAVTTAQHQNPPEDLTMGMCIFPCAHTQRILYVWPRPAPPHFPLRPHAMVMVLMQAACRRL